MNVVAPALHIPKYRAYMTAFFQVQTFRLMQEFPEVRHYDDDEQDKRP